MGEATVAMPSLDELAAQGLGVVITYDPADPNPSWIVTIGRPGFRESGTGRAATFVVAVADAWARFNGRPIQEARHGTTS